MCNVVNKCSGSIWMNLCQPGHQGTWVWGSLLSTTGENGLWYCRQKCWNAPWVGIKYLTKTFDLGLSWPTGFRHMEKVENNHEIRLILEIPKTWFQCWSWSDSGSWPHSSGCESASVNWNVSTTNNVQLLFHHQDTYSTQSKQYHEQVKKGVVTVLCGVI